MTVAKTNDSLSNTLIDDLVGKLTPVKRLPTPLVRALSLIALATVVIALFTVWRGFRSDISERLGEPAYVIAIASAWLTGATGTLAAFNISLPDRSRWWLVVPLPAGILWVWGVGYGCLAHWIAIPAGAPVEAESIACLETLVGTSIPLGIALWFMIRRAKPLRGNLAALLSAGAIAAFADLAHLLLHVVNATVLVLTMNFGVTGIIVLLSTLIGRRSFGVLKISS